MQAYVEESKQAATQGAAVNFPGAKPHGTVRVLMVTLLAEFFSNTLRY